MKLDLKEILGDAQKVWAKELTVGRVAKEIQLEKLGFKAIHSKLQTDNKLSKLAKYKYVKITEDKIKVFIDRKAKEYDESIPNVQLNHKGPMLSEMHFRPGSIYYANTPGDTYNYWGHDEIERPIDNYVYSKHTNHYTSEAKDTIGRFEWVEKPLEKIEELPPDNVLIKLAEHKQRNIFDYFTIAKVEGMYDPLLFGRIKGSTDRFFIAQWGDDVSLDDVI